MEQRKVAEHTDGVLAFLICAGVVRQRPVALPIQRHDVLQSAILPDYGVAVRALQLFGDGRDGRDDGAAAPGCQRALGECGSQFVVVWPAQSADNGADFLAYDASLAGGRDLAAPFLYSGGVLPAICAAVRFRLGIGAPVRARRSR